MHLDIFTTRHSQVCLTVNLTNTSWIVGSSNFVAHGYTLNEAHTTVKSVEQKIRLKMWGKETGQWPVSKELGRGHIRAKEGWLWIPRVPGIHTTRTIYEKNSAVECIIGEKTLSRFVWIFIEESYGKRGTLKFQQRPSDNWWTGSTIKPMRKRFVVIRLPKLGHARPSWS